MSDSTAVGEVGLFADEVAQRLCSVFGEAALACLETLKELSTGRGDPTKFLGLYQAGLATVPNWTVDVVQDEVTRIEAKYSEARLLLHYVYVLLVNMLDPNSTSPPPYIPSLVEAYHLFLKKLCAQSDVRLCTRFFDQSFACKRAVFLECLRMALHDLVRQHYRFCSAPPAAARSLLDAADDEATSANPEQPSAFRKAVSQEAAAVTGAEEEKQVEVSPAFFFKAGGESVAGPESQAASRS
jgi:hypothetical protein